MSSADRVAALALVLVAGCRGGQKEARERNDVPLRVAAAADLAFAFKDIGAELETRTGKPVVFSFGSTGLLAKQVIEGAPFDVFAAASESFLDDTVRAGRCSADAKVRYGRGRIVVWWRKDAKVKAPTSIAELSDARFRKIAIANPEHAPYGKAAEEALERAGIWDAVKAKLVFGENVQQTLAYGQSGDVDAAIVALSLATVSEGNFLLIDDAQHQPIDQVLTVCGSGERVADARRFTEFVASPAGRSILRRYGFLLAGETMEPGGERKFGDKGMAWQPLLLSFEVAAAATAIAGLLGVALAALLARRRFVGRDLFDALLTAPMVLPPTVLGYYLLSALSGRSAIGHLFAAVFGSPIVFTKFGAVVAATVGALPLVVKASRAALEEVDPTLIDAARTLGATPARAFFTVRLPLAGRGIVAGLTLGFARSLGDFGVTLMVAGDIPGQTRTASLAIYDAIQSQDSHRAVGMIVVLTAFAVAALYAVNKLTARRDDR